MVKKAIVKIPNVAEEVRIGYSFNYLVRVIAETEASPLRAASSRPDSIRTR